MTAHVEVLDLVAQMKAAEQAFVLATVVRTVSVTAAKAGAKAIIARRHHRRGLDRRRLRQGRGAEGGARGARRRRAAHGVGAAGKPAGRARRQPGESRDGIRFASNMCPSKGTMDIFVEPVLPHPSLVILGASPVALSLAAQARAARLSRHAGRACGRSRRRAGGRMPSSTATSSRDLNDARRFVVVSTQGKGDEAALRAAVATEAEYHAFVGSRRKMASLREKLIAEGANTAAIDRVKAPAGLDLGAITPEEIAMSILAEITVERRRGQRKSATRSEHRSCR